MGISITHSSDTMIVNNIFNSTGIRVGGASENITIKQNQIIGGGFDSTTTQDFETISLEGNTVNIYENNITNCGVGFSFFQPSVTCAMPQQTHFFFKGAKKENES